MRPLTEEETKVVFEKLANYIGRNIAYLVDNKEDPHIFRLQKDRVYYISDKIAKFATSVSRVNLMSVGICMGKFTKTGKFKLHVTSLSILSKYAKYKIWIKQNGEMPFLYGNHVLKAHIGRMSDDIPEHAGVIVYSMSDVPLGFGVSAKSTGEARNLQPTAITAFRQSDIGEYLREEDTLFT
ncbi:60S ribosome subunit biogenesis protein [Wickerhamomyces ciferrii]|uniref:60S ribosome subunit biogenesis protein NIP7 n=1 Tax=Wickerhamomyces ciferrii (strain ATCC 14091 / BCRC 22168 / CBS 111 / JCM 3599 / NBRC 0793 / NRRL Y-1031 F-60-10) TaxID=1206466 RepID=K0KVX7_WICCF|nr:60S ribosome subunit biogenesis protein [Wickerhamomyces ciferrii]CCH45659.1 60S ribosome subunit biogenesis protein [Wickerhamomyces ciferrii]